MLLLGGNDRSLRLFSVVKDSTSCELSQGMLFTGHVMVTLLLHVLVRFIGEEG